jgi:peptidoglycan/LPS O-acetylase OafA/YrhL
VTLVLVVVLLRPDSRQLPGEGFFDPRLVLVANILLLHSIVPYVNYVFSWNSPSWSISTEWFFYLMFPLLLKDIHRTCRGSLRCSPPLSGPMVPCSLCSKSRPIRIRRT